jgi:hypothetical protein
MPARAAQLVTIEEASRVAYQHWDGGDADRAERVCRQILTARADYADALHLLGLIAHARKDGARAIDYLVRACRARGRCSTAISPKCAGRPDAWMKRKWPRAARWRRTPA